jgi:Protein of unknown function (DUF2924)
MAQVASLRTASWDESRSAHPKSCLRTATARRGEPRPRSAASTADLSAASERSASSVDPGLVLKAGSTLVRQWRGYTHTVLVGENGFGYEGQRYRSLTVIAERITGAHWSGPRFFGLIRRTGASVSAEAGP